MVTEIAIYLEGGGPTSATMTPFRQGMSGFLKPIVELVRKRRIKWKIIPCGGRSEAYKYFCDALTNEPEVFNVLLVDSETLPVAALPWDHLSQREGDLWKKPVGVTDDNCHLMAACMEAWIITDRDALKKHFKKGFDESKLPMPQYAEATEKAVIADSLDKATKNTTAGAYKKIHDGAKLLLLIDPAVVRQHCKWCDRLFVILASKIGENI